MDTASVSNCSSGSVYTHSRRQTSSLALPHQLSRPPRHDQYEISGLAQIFHSDLLRRPGSQMDAALISKSSSGSMYSYSRRQTSSLALPHQPSLPPRHDQYEISGLAGNRKKFLIFFEHFFIFSVDSIKSFFSNFI
ncbi:MAG: hypothetical protein QE493_04480 [Verrucomicrobiae bacterium]|nr:hypothetical protein [Verrucomicrobiae bacterium]